MSDFASERSILISQLKNILETITVILQTILEDRRQSIVCFFLFLSLFLLQIIYAPYINLTIQLNHQCLITFNFFLSFNILLTAYVNGWNQFNIFLLVSIPLTYRMAYQIYNFRQEQIIKKLFSENVNEIQQHEEIKINNNQKRYKHYAIDYYLRTLYYGIQLDFDNYLCSQTSVLLEKIYLNHIQNCLQPKSCFCQNQIDEKDRTLRSNILNDYIERYYEFELSKCKKMSFLHSSYLSFLLDVQGNFNKFYVKANQILNTCDCQILYMKQIKMLIQKAKEIQRSALYCSRNTEEQQLEFIEMIKFDEIINECFKQIKIFLQQKKQTLLSISSDFIDIKVMNKDLTKIFKQRKDVHLIINDLIKKNIYSQQLEFLIEIYENYLLVGNDLSKQYKKVKQINILSYKQLKQNYAVDVDETKGFAFISLSDKIGQIVKVSNNFEKIIKISNNKQAVGKNISFLQPYIIAKSHDQILKSFLEQRNKINQTAHLYPIIGIDKDQWAIPYNIKLQPCQLESYNFGICAQISLINDNKMYILADNKQNLKISTVSYQFYSQILAESIPKQNISKISLSVLIPCFPMIFEIYKQNFQKQIDNKQVDREFTTILFKPNSYEQLIKLESLVFDYKKVFQLLDFQIFGIKGEIYHIQNQHIDIVQIKLNEIVQIFDDNLKIEQMNQLQNWIEINKPQAQPSPHSFNQIANELFNQLSENYNNYGFAECSQITYEGARETINLKKIDYQNSFETGGLLSPQFRQKISMSEEKIFNEQNLQENTKLLLANSYTPKNVNMTQNNIQLNRINTIEKDNQSYRSNQEMYQIRNNELYQIKNSEFKQSQAQRAAFISEYNTLDTLRNRQSGLNYFIDNQKIKAKEGQSYQKNLNSEIKDSKQFSSNQEQQDIKIETSINSSRQSSVLRQSIIKKMNQNEKFTGIYIVRLFGVLGLFTFLIVSSLLFYNLNVQLQNQKNDYQNVSWGSQIKGPMGEVLSDRLFALLIQTPPFNYQGQEQIQLQQRIQQQQIKNYYTIKNLMIRFIESDKSKTDLYNFVLDQKLNQVFVTSNTTFTQTQLYFGYSLQINLAQLFYVSQNLDPQALNQNQISSNYIANYNLLSNITKDVSVKVNQTFDQNAENMLTFLIAIMVTTLIFALTFPIINYYFLQKIQIILKLFATLTPKNLNCMIQETMNCLHLIEQNNLNLEDKSIYTKHKIQSQQNLQKQIEDSIQKKKNISATNSIHEFKIKVAVISLVFFILSQVATVTNYFLLNNFIQQEKVNRKFIGDLMSVSDYVINIEVIRSPLILLSLQQSVSQEYLNLAIKDANQKQNYLQILNDLVNQLYDQDMQSDFKEYSINIFQQNACQTINENQNLLSDQLFQIEECNQLANGIFQKGFIQVAQFLINLYAQRISAFLEDDLEKFIELIIIQEKEFKRSVIILVFGNFQSFSKQQRIIKDLFHLSISDMQQYYEHNSSKSNHMKRQQHYVVDIYIRTLYQCILLDFDEYLSSQTSILQEKIYIDHIRNCQAPKSCFCQDQIDEKDKTLRSNILYDYIEKFFEYFQMLKDEFPSYFLFIIFVRSLGQIFYKIQIQLLIQMAQDQQEGSFSMQSKNTICQQLDFMDIIEFDETISLCLNQMKHYLLQKHYTNDESKAFAFISLSENIGQIVKVSNSFEKVVKISNNKNVIGQNINFFQPSIIAKYHDQILKSFLNKKYKSNCYSMHHNPIIGIDLEQWAVAYEIKLQPSLLENYNYGICAQISQLNDNNMYILVDKKQKFQISTVSYQFYSQILAEAIPKEKIAKISLSTLIPSFPIIFEEFKQMKGGIYFISNQHVEIIQIKVKEIVQIVNDNQKIEQLCYLQKYMESNQKKQQTQLSYNQIENQILSYISNNCNNDKCFIECSQNSQEVLKESHNLKQLEFQNSYETGVLLSPQLVQKVFSCEEKIFNEILLQENNLNSQKHFNLSQNKNELENRCVFEKENQFQLGNQDSTRNHFKSTTKYFQEKRVTFQSEYNTLDSIKNKQCDLNFIFDNYKINKTDTKGQFNQTKSEKQATYISKNLQKQKAKITASVNSSKSSQISRKQIMKNINKNEKFTGIYLVRFFGVIGLTSFLIISFILFQSLNLQLQNQKEDYQNINWGSQIKSPIGEILSDQLLGFLIQIPPFNFQDQDQIQLQQRIQQQKIKNYDTIKQLIIRFINSDKSKTDLYNYVLDNQFLQMLVSSNTTTSQNEFYFGYSLLINFAQMFYISFNLDITGLSSKEVSQNYIYNYKLLSNITQDVSDKSFIEKEKVSRKFIDDLMTVSDYVINIDILRAPFIFLKLQNIISQDYVNLAISNAQQKQKYLQLLNGLVNQLYEEEIELEFKDYTIKAFQQNACEAVSQNQNLLSDSLFKLNECNQIAKQVFSKGFVQATQYLINMYSQRISAFLEDDLFKFIELIQIQEQEFTNAQNFYARIYFEYIIETLVKKMAQITYEHYDNMIIMNYIYLFLAIRVNLLEWKFRDYQNSSIDQILLKYFTIKVMQGIIVFLQLLIKNLIKRDFSKLANMIPKSISQNQQLSNLKTRFTDFYSKFSYPLLKSFNRNKKVTVFLLLIKHIEFTFLQISPDIKNKIMIKDQNNQFIKYFMLLFDNSNLNNTFFYIFMTINGVLVITYLLYFGIYLSSQKIKNNNLLISFFFQIYYYTLFIPTLMLSFNQIDNKPVPVYFNLGLILFITWIQGLHEYDYRYKTNDYLSFKSIPAKLITTFVEILNVLLLNYASWNQVSIINLIFFFFLLVIDVVYVPYINRETQIINTFGIMFHFFFSINLIYVLQVEKWNIFNLFLILLFPLSYKMSQVFHSTKKYIILNRLINRDRSILFTSGNKNMINQYVKSYQPFIVDYYLRSLYKSVKTDFDDYLSSKGSLILEDLITSHQIYCIQPQFCFCTQKFDEKDNTIRQEYLYDYIERYYENEIQKSKSYNILHISYLYFLVDVQKNPNKCLVKVYQLLAQSKYHSIIYRQIVNNLIEVAKDALFKQNQNKFIQNQSLNSNPQYINFINFDADINLCYKNIQECLNMKKSAILQIGQDTIDIQSIWLQLKLTRDKRNQIFTTLHNLIRKQIPSQQMNFLIEIFEKSLCFDERLSALKKKVNQRFLRFDHQQKPLYLFDQNTCSAFISLTNIGQITMVSNNFDKVVPIFSNSESIGKNINFMQPPAVSVYHDKILNNYLTKIRNQKSQLTLSPIIGIDKEGWAIPYDIKLQPCLIESKDFGICAQIKQIEGVNMYILVDQKDFRIICNSQEFYDQILSKVVSKKQLQEVNISKLIPSLKLILSKNYNAGENFQAAFSTIMIKPSDKSEMIALNEFKVKQRNLNQLLEFDLFSIKGKVYSISNHFIQLLQIQIEDMVHLSDQNVKIEEIKNFKEQLIQNKDLYEQIYQEEKTHSLQFLSNQYLESQSSPFHQKKTSQEKQTQFQSSNQTKEYLNYNINQITSNANQIYPFSQYSQNNEQQNEISANQFSFIQEINYENSNQYQYAEDEFQFTKIMSPQTSVNLINQQSGQQMVQDDKDNSLLYDGKKNFPSQQKRFVFFNKKQQSTFEGTKQSDTFLAQQTKLSSCNLLQQQGVLSTSRQNNNVNSNQQEVSQKDSTMRDSLSRQIQQVKIKQDINVEGSVQTSQSGRTAFRKSIIESIQAQLKIKGLTVVKLVWGIAFFGFLILNIFNYYSLGQSLKTQKSQYKYIDWGSKLITTLSQTICDQMLIQALAVPYFQPKLESQKNIVKDVQNKQIQRHQIMKQLMLDYVNSDKQESDIFSFAVDYHQTFTFAFTTVRITNYYLSFGYIQEALFGYMYQEVYSLDPLGQNSLQISLNYVNTTNSVSAIQNYVNNKLNDNFDSTIQQEFVSMIIILVTSILFSISFIPIYSLIQSKREEILILFTTFSPNKLMLLLSETINYINILQISEERLNINQNNHKKKDLTKSYGQLNNIDVKGLIKKKKNISTFNRLPKFNIKILFYSALFFVLVQIHSITSYFLVKDFFNSERSNRLFINDFLNVTDFTSALNSQRIPLVLLTLAQNKDLLALYIARGETNLSRVGLELNLLYSIVDNYYSVTRYKQDEFNKYISGILEGNACNQVSENINLLTDSGFSADECNQAANGIFTQGLVKAVKQICEISVSRMPVFYIKNLKVFLAEILEQEKTYSFIDSYYYRLYLFYIVQSVQQKVANITYDHYDLMITLNHILLAISLVSQIFAIIIAYFKFFQQQMNQLKETKLLLDLVEIHALEENQYILTYFKLSK
ncbi:hypothetical protein ABPG74_004240 [Tetrahymena malaccensis]